MVVQGKIYAQGEYDGLQGAKVTDVNSGNFVKTDANGSFILLVANPLSLIEISNAGYKKQTMTAASFSSFVTLKPDLDNPVDLDDVIITDDQTDNTMLYLGLGAAALAAIYFATRKKPKKVKVY